MLRALVAQWELKVLAVGLALVFWVFVETQGGPRTTRTLPVVPQVQGHPAPAHVLGRVRVEPPTVQITGPRTTIESRRAVDTLPVDVSGHRQGLTRTVGLALPDSVHPVDRRTVEVTVDIRPEETMQERSSGGTRR
jgi:YbbR domain-containing protein